MDVPLSLALGDDAFDLVETAICTGSAVLDDVAADLARPAALTGLGGSPLDGTVVGGLCACVAELWGASLEFQGGRFGLVGRGGGRGMDAGHDETHVRAGGLEVMDSVGRWLADDQRMRWEMRMVQGR